MRSRLPPLRRVSQRGGMGIPPEPRGGLCLRDELRPLGPSSSAVLGARVDRRKVDRLEPSSRGPTNQLGTDPDRCRTKVRPDGSSRAGPS